MTSGSTLVVRRVDGDSEFVSDIKHLPVLITTWFGSPTLDLAEAYAKWLSSFVERSRVRERRFVILDDASAAARPSPPVRGRLAKIECPADIVIDRVVVVQSAAIRGAVTALSWSTGKAIKTAASIEEGVRDCLALLDEAGVAQPRKFDVEQVQPSSRPR